ETGQARMLTDPEAHVLATIRDNEPITREELGEFLIQRYGAERLELLVNKHIIDRACAARNITVSDAEIDADLDAQLARAGIDLKAFTETVLRPQKKNLSEYREDAVRPRLQLARLGAADVAVTPDDLKKAFEAHHGEKVECRLIIWPRGEERFAQ